MILEVEIQLMITVLIVWMISGLLASWKWNTEDIMKMAAIKLYYSQNDNDMKKSYNSFDESTYQNDVRIQRKTKSYFQLIRRQEKNKEERIKEKESMIERGREKRWRQSKKKEEVRQGQS